MQIQIRLRGTWHLIKVSGFLFAYRMFYKNENKMKYTTQREIQIYYLKTEKDRSIW